VEEQPASRLVIDLAALKLSHDGGEVPLGLPPAAQEAFVAGAWDATGMLTADPDQIRAIAASLPYISGFASK